MQTPGSKYMSKGRLDPLAGRTQFPLSTKASGDTSRGLFHSNDTRLGANRRKNKAHEQVGITGFNVGILNQNKNRYKLKKDIKITRPIEQEGLN